VCVAGSWTLVGGNGGAPRRGSARCASLLRSLIRDFPAIPWLDGSRGASPAGEPRRFRPRRCRTARHCRLAGPVRGRSTSTTSGGSRLHSLNGVHCRHATARRVRVAPPRRKSRGECAQGGYAANGAGRKERAAHASGGGAGMRPRSGPARTPPDFFRPAGARTTPHTARAVSTGWEPRRSRMKHETRPTLRSDGSRAGEEG